MEINQGNPSIKKIKVKTMPHDPAYLLAEKKIEECWRIREQQLDLSNMELTELPVSIGKCTHLKKLDLSKNNLMALPESIGQLVQLQYLNLSNNKFMGLPEIFSNLTELIDLELEVNRFTTFPRVIGMLPILKNVWFGDSFGGNPLDNLPKHMDGLNELSMFSFDHCKLNDLPNWIGELPKLEYLTLTSNPLNPELAEAYKDGIDGIKPTCVPKPKHNLFSPKLN